MRATTELEQQLTEMIQRRIDRCRENARIEKHRENAQRARRWLEQAESLERELAEAYKKAGSVA